jgi:hypothetical protein
MIHLPGEQTKKNGMGRPCGTYGGTGDVHTGFEIREGRRPLSRLRRTRRVILKRILNNWDGIVDWIALRIGTGGRLL